MQQQKRALLMDEHDNCIVALEHINKGDIVNYGNGVLTALDSIDLGHKLALTDLHPGDKVIKHNCSIGSVYKQVKKGMHLHTHNLKSDYIIGYHTPDAGVSAGEDKASL